MRNNKPLKIFIIIALILVVIISALSLLVLKDPNKDKYKVEPSTKLMQDIIISTVQSSELKVSQDELNGALAYRLTKESSNGSVNGLYFDLQDMKDDKVKVYMPITYKSIDLGVSAYVKPSLDKENNVFCFEISNAKVGLLPISSKMLADKIKNSEPDMFTSADNKLFVNSYIKYDIHSTSVKIQIDEFRIEDGQVVIKTSGLLKTVEDLFKDFIIGD